MKTGTYILDSIKEKFGVEEKEDGFPDMNYVVGNTSGLDIGNVPSPLDRRIGRMAQIGGSVMEIVLTNPATFQIDRPELFNVIENLGLDAHFHGDPNIGFTGGYATRGQGVTGYNIVHRYLKRYLEQLASFKWEKDLRGFTFDVGYLNMHASNEQIPPREERLASDVSVDPFQERITTINGDKSPNIYRNKDFMEKLFDYFFIQKVDRPFQYYEQVFSDLSDTFHERWNDAKEDVADDFYRQENDGFDQVAGLFQTAANIDQGLDRDFSDALKGTPLKEPIEMTTIREDEEGRREVQVTLETIDELKAELGGRQGIFSTPRQLFRDYDIVEDRLDERRAEIVGRTVEDRLNELWLESDEISTEAKVSALVRHEDYQQSQVLEKAQSQVRDEARKTFAGRYSDQEEDEDYYLKILEYMTQGRLKDEFNKESSLFFHILPAWMQTADWSGHEEHPGWEAPKFIWEHVLKTSDVEDEDIMDMSWDEFDRFLSRSRENQLNVIAAAGAAYIWGHFTQVEDRFERDAFRTQYYEQNLDEEDLPELDDGDDGYYTWIEWMNEFDLRVNLEAMYGDPGQLRRVWRPKDIAIVCHAINQTAERDLEDYDEPLVKFTIDMEHTSSYGVDPWREVQELVEQEGDMAEAGDITADPAKPLSKILKTYHLTKPGWEQQQGHRHGPFTRGDTTLYYWLYNLVKSGFARDDEDPGIVMFEVGGEYQEEMYVIRVALNMIELGIEPEDLDPNRVDPSKDEYEDEEEALIARFFGMDQPNVDREWAKIEEHAFDPLKGLLEADEFDYTWSSNAAVEQGGKRPGEWKNEEYR